MKKLAIVGSGIAGLGCAHFLDRDFDVTVYEKDGHVGGHSNTVTVNEDGRDIAVDTGFVVFNRVTYPNLIRLFADLQVRSRPASMSFSVQHAPTGLEYCGSSLNHLFAQRKNLFNLRFIRMLARIARFNRQATEALDDPRYARMTLREYVRERGYGEDFQEFYLIPMSSAVWSSAPERIREFPVMTLLRFFHNHGFLGLHTQHPWWTVEGGARAYVEKLTARLRNRVRTGRAAAKIERQGNRVSVTDSSGAREAYDKVILATHADQALKLLDNPTDLERRVLGRFGYQPNRAVLHTDASLMPRARLAWSSWNYRIQSDDPPRVECSTTYWMNRLQSLECRRQYFVSINPPRLDEKDVIMTIPYEHPVFDLGAIEAQKDLASLNRVPGCATYYCGSYFRYGFHEDALTSSVELSRTILGRSPWE